MPLVGARNDDCDGNPGTMRMETKQVTPGPPAQGVAGTGLPSAPGTSIIPNNFFGFVMISLGLR